MVLIVNADKVCESPRRSSPIRKCVAHISSSSIPVLSRRSNLAFALETDLVSLRTIVHQHFLEPRMLKSVLGRDPLLRVIHKDPLQQVQKFSVELSMGGNSLLFKLLLK
jgi:hypothetical protein